MTSIEIAEVTGKQHKNVMQAIRNMETAWDKVPFLQSKVPFFVFLIALLHTALFAL